MEVQSSSSFKVRALLQQLRPLLLQVLGTPEFRNCKAGHELRKNVELLMSLYKQMVLEMNKPAGKAMPEFRRTYLGSMPTKEEHERKKQKLSQPVHLVRKETEGGSSSTTLSSDKKKPTASSRLEGSYVVGGSVSGWNFITFGGAKPVYYGVKKESFRSNRKVVKDDVVIRRQFNRSS